MSGRRPRRRREGAQAAFEMALVLPIMLVITLGFIGVMLELRAATEFQSAVDLAAQASIVPPMPASCDPPGPDCPDPRSLNLEDASYAFSATLNPTGSESGYLTVTRPLSCSGPYLEGQVQPGLAQPVVCSAQGEIDFSRSPIGILWFWKVNLSATAEAVPSPYRQCQALTAIGPC
ncbi:MAG: hypothetical protein WCB85_13835 [Candidatus Dormiibacterota bacterium]